MLEMLQQTESELGVLTSPSEANKLYKVKKAETEIFMYVQ